MNKESRIPIRVVSGDVASFLEKINSLGVVVYDVKMVDDLTAQLSVERKWLSKVAAVVEKRGDRLEWANRESTGGVFSRLLSRPILIAGICFLLFLILYLPGKILFVTVEGNNRIPDNQILEQAESCRISFGCPRRYVRSEQMKNMLLERIPELKWVGINTYGCLAVIQVREREAEESIEDIEGTGNIVASRDGVIRSVEIWKGDPLCQVGDAVKEGDILVSGFVDYGIVTQAQRAKAEIYANTSREITVQTPLNCLSRGPVIAIEKKYGLIIGKNRINFYKGSRIFDTGCVKMYTEEYLTLPGGFVLPVAFIQEVWITYEMQDTRVDSQYADALMRDVSRGYVNSLMVAGEILDQEETVSASEFGYQLYGKYSCLEMIGREKNEEIWQYNGESDGTDR